MVRPASNAAGFASAVEVPRLVLAANHAAAVDVVGGRDERERERRAEPEMSGRAPVDALSAERPDIGANQPRVEDVGDEVDRERRFRPMYSETTVNMTKPMA